MALWAGGCLRCSDWCSAETVPQLWGIKDSDEFPALSHAGHLTPALWDDLEGFMWRWMKLKPCCTIFMFHEQYLVCGPGREHSGSSKFSSSVTVAEF